MQALIDNLRQSSVLVQAIAVMAGGLIGVFATLLVFYIGIRLMEAIGSRKSS
jgi:hypothetical protein